MKPNQLKSLLEKILLKQRWITFSLGILKETILESAELEVFGIKSIEIMEENILLIIMAENTLDETPREILIDEGVRLSKKFCSENSYKFINATLEKILES